ncbi:molecular chaperone DnaK [Pseudonocardia sulfidoxydans NBRC 16205]|uniref:Molecular chaperone DnaK n=1 Tax=Pseudonocardia sulfidoxydans NBRC 16205 TaxID=1223511 RepID=A0A511DAL9_9PSEU|nr:Hsp70 family protein [Pseudonocardia sulfidoxydans]GEL21850.1 molecular chaperone DnaK [Pseudonocardia sulfidoxydans NBRC 16205]
MAVHGIDLGTTNSAVARIAPDGSPVVLAGMSGEPTTPSVVLFASRDEYVVGEGARREARLDPEHVCALVKRRMGDAAWRFVAHGKAWSAPAVSSLILSSLVADARFADGEEPTSAVITVPAYFGDEERRATVQAGVYAGLDVVDVLSEPIAAALSYGFGRLDGSVGMSGVGMRKADGETVLVYDLGGGTFDVAVIELADRRISVLAVEGDHQLGGADWDERLALHLSRRFAEAAPGAEDPLDDSAGAQALVLAAERAKHELSDADRTDVVVAHDGARVTVPVTRAELTELTAPLLRRTIDLTRSCLAEAARRGVDRVDRVLLVGGSSRMPSVAEALRAELGLEPLLHDPDLAVARGAALYGEKKELERMVAADLRTRGRLRDGDPVEDAPSADLDDACRRVADAFSVPLAQVRRAVEIRVDTVVSRGFGVLAVSDAGRLEPSWLVHRNDRLPVRTSRSFGTVRADQSVVALTVVEQQGQAESQRTQDVKILIQGEITGIPPGHDEGSEIRVTFEMGFDGVLHVTAFHVDAAMPLELTATTGATLSQAEVARERDQLGRARRRG